MDEEERARILERLRQECENEQKRFMRLYRFMKCVSFLGMGVNAAAMFFSIMSSNWIGVIINFCCWRVYNQAAYPKCEALGVIPYRLADNATMRPYQLRAAHKIFVGSEAANDNERDGTAVILDMGLGKTIIVLQAIAELIKLAAHQQACPDRCAHSCL